MAHNETRNGLNETERLPRTWSRSTVADGQWMQKNTLGPYRNSDWFLASAIDGLLDKDDELTQAIADETAARQQNDSDLSAWCTRLTNSAEDLYSGLSDEVAARQAAIEEEQRARTQGDADTLASAKEYANDASAHALAEAKTYTNTASSYLDGRIDGVSSTFNSYSSNMNTWKSGIDNWQTGINKWRNETVDPALTDLQSQIDAFENATDVADVVSTSASLNGYNKRLTPGAVIKVLSAGPGNDQQFYYRNKLEKTSAGPFHIENFDVLGSVQPYYSKSETYSKSELYNQSQIDAKLANKLDTSAEHIYQYLAVEIPGQTGKYITVLNNMEILADHALYDYQGNAIHETYAQKSALSDYATKTYVNGTFASANNVYAKNQTSGKDQLNTAFGNKLDTSAALSAYFHQPSTHGPSYDDPYSAMKVTSDGNPDVFTVNLYRKNNNQYETMYTRRNDDIILIGKTIEIWNFTSMPDFSTNPDTYYII